MEFKPLKLQSNMKREDIDKRIGMPDVDAEWARFEREVIGKNTKPSWQRVAAWAGGIGIAAAIALLFVLNMGNEESAGLPVMAQLEEEKHQATQQTEKQPLVAQTPAGKPLHSSTEKEQEAIMHLAGICPPKGYIPSPVDSNFQKRVARLEIVPTAADLGPGHSVRLAGSPHEEDSVLFVIDGKPILLAVDWFVTGTVEEIERVLQVDIDNVMVYKDDSKTQPYVEQFGEVAKRGIVDIKTKPAPRTFEYGGLANAATEEALQGRIAGQGRIHFVSETERPALPYLWERDTVLALVNGKEDPDFLRFLSSTPHVSMSNVYDYFFERNQLFLMQSVLSKEELKAQYEASLFEGSDIRLVVDYQAKPFTPVSQLTPEQINSRRLAYLQNKYRAGFSKNSNQDYYAPDLYDSPTKERLFGLTAAKCRSYGQRHEYFGPMGSDSHGIYVPLIRDAVLTTQDDARWENGEVWVLKDDPRFNQIARDIRQAATHAESSAMTNGDSIVRLAFIFGGKVIEGQTNDQLSGMQKKLYKQVKDSTFAFKPDADAPSWWWAEAYYSTTSQRQLWMHLHSVDKLYTADCPELLNNRRHVEGTVTDEKGEPLAEASVGIGFVTPWDAITTDIQGRFDLWMPFHDATIRVTHVGYQTISRTIQPADTILNFRMKDATRIREVKVRGVE